MKKLYFILFVFCFLQTVNAQQFHSLDGIESSTGQTILLYRLGSEQYHSNPIFKFNVQTGYEKQIMDAREIYFPVGADVKTVIDFEFFSGDTTNFMNIGDLIYMDYSSYIAKNDSIVFGHYSQFYRIDISKQHPQKVFAFRDGGPFRSWDGGLTFPEDSVWAITNFIPIALADFDDNVMFGFNEDNKFSKNTEVVDTSLVAFDQYSKLLYDSNQFHVYRVNWTYGGYSLSVSNNKGNAFTWTKTYQSENPIYVSIDSTQSGVIYLADGRKIHKSNNNGYNFTEYKSLPSKLIGIYKKPNSEIIYAASKSMIFKVTQDSVIIIKSLPIPEEEYAWFPLAIGNKWAFNSFWSEENIGYPPTVTFVGTKFMEVIKDTIIQSKNYFVVENNLLTQMVFEPRMYLRVDSTSGFVYRYWEDLNGEFLFHNLNAEVGDTIPNARFPEEPYYLLMSEEPISFLDNETFIRNYIENLPCGCGHSLIRGYGLASAHFNEFGGSDDYLKGCIINGISYGDTSNIVGVEAESNLIPTEFKLEQNYPNPFNPSTKIKYSVPSITLRQAQSVIHISLKVYDVLGREIVTLVNEEKTVGSYEVEFNASQLPSGVYFYQIKAGDLVQTRKMALLK